MRHLETNRTSREGSALFTSVMLISLIATLTYSFLSLAIDATDQTETDVDRRTVDMGAESITALAIDRIWGTFDAQRAGQDTSREDYRVYLDSLGIRDESGLPDPAGTDLLPLLALPLVDGVPTLAGVEIETLRAIRTDEANSIRLEILATVAHRAYDAAIDDWHRQARSIREVVLIEPMEWSGLDFALLANNINCIMCHAEIDSAERAYNKDPQRYGTFDRVKVGSIETLQLRNNADSWIAGTLYLGGTAFDQSGNAITNWARQDVKSMLFDADGHLYEDQHGAMDDQDLNPADSASPLAHENLYLEYGSDPDKMVDGYAPTDFPAVFPDDGGSSSGAPAPGAGNRIIDQAEFDAAVANVDGSVSGGTISVVSGNGYIDQESELNSLFDSPNATSLQSVTQGSVVLVGTDAKPIQLDGDVAIQGDLVIYGKVQGEGSFMVSGNVYIPEDLQYVDGTDSYGDRTFGRDAGGNANSLAIASGGNVVVGNLFHSRGGRVTGDTRGGFSFILDELAIFNRSEWTKTQEFLPGDGEPFRDQGSWSVANPLYEPNYKPRYYVFNEGGTIPIYNKGLHFDPVSRSWIGREHPGRWGLGRLSYAHENDPSDPYLYNPDGSPKAAVLSLTAQGWMSDDMLRKLMLDRALARSSRQDDPMEVDALLYSNNSIFGVIPPRRRGPGFDGRMTVNGGIVAADIGLLAPNKIQIRYDARPKDLLNITSETSIRLRRLLRAPVAP